MPTLSASDYTSFIKAQAESLAYRNRQTPSGIQTIAQPYAIPSALNARLLASQAALIVTPGNAAIVGNARIRPYTGKGPVNNPKSLSTVHNSTSTAQSSGKFAQTGGLPLTAAKWDGVYSPTPHLARVDTKATGAYEAVRQPV
jgi:hypothetical protein